MKGTHSSSISSGGGGGSSNISDNNMSKNNFLSYWNSIKLFSNPNSQPSYGLENQSADNLVSSNQANNSNKNSHGHTKKQNYSSKASSSSSLFNSTVNKYLGSPFFHQMIKKSSSESKNNKHLDGKQLPVIHKKQTTMSADSSQTNSTTNTNTTIASPVAAVTTASSANNISKNSTELSEIENSKLLLHWPLAAILFMQLPKFSNLMLTTNHKLTRVTLRLLLLDKCPELSNLKSKLTAFPFDVFNKLLCTYCDAYSTETLPEASNSTCSDTNLWLLQDDTSDFEQLSLKIREEALSNGSISYCLRMLSVFATQTESCNAYSEGVTKNNDNDNANSDEIVTGHQFWSDKVELAIQTAISNILIQFDPDRNTSNFVGCLQKQLWPSQQLDQLDDNFGNMFFNWTQIGSVVEVLPPAVIASSNSATVNQSQDEKNYWAKGTGFGTGAVNGRFNPEEALRCQKLREYHCDLLMSLLTAYLFPQLLTDQRSNVIDRLLDVNTSLEMKLFSNLAEQQLVILISRSALFSIIENYLRNDSILDISNRVNLYSNVFNLLKSLIVRKSLWIFFDKLEYMLKLLNQVDTQIQTYIDRLKKMPITKDSSALTNLYGNNKFYYRKAPLSTGTSGGGGAAGGGGNTNRSTLTRQSSIRYHHGMNAVKSFSANKQNLDTAKNASQISPSVNNDLCLMELCKQLKILIALLTKLEKEMKLKSEISESATASEVDSDLKSNLNSLDEKYCSIMKPIQFQICRMVRTNSDGSLTFLFRHAYSSYITKINTNNSHNNTTAFTNSPSWYNFRAVNVGQNQLSSVEHGRRLVQETVTLSCSLPLSSSSSVFLRCDEERLDLMKVLISGPADTPYSNGLFEFDIFFPSNYPQSPPNVTLVTTGNGSVRFNPNLYNDGKVCLSILNTWHGRPEERWNPNTSTLLQILVSIQSLIFVSEPYFNEPGYERTRDTTVGRQACLDYDLNIQHACVRHAMLEMLKYPPPAFVEVVENHFKLKKDEIRAQLCDWIDSHTKILENRKPGGLKLTINSVSTLIQSVKEFLSLLDSKYPSTSNEENDEEIDNDDDDDDSSDQKTLIDLTPLPKFSEQADQLLTSFSSSSFANTDAKEESSSETNNNLDSDSAPNSVNWNIFKC